MTKIYAVLAATVTLAFGGCASSNQFGNQLADAALTAGGSLVKTVEANPSLIPCLASQAALVANGVLGPKGSAIRRTNRQTVRISKGLCDKLGGSEQTTTAAK